MSLRTVIIKGGFQYDEIIFSLEDAILQSPDRILIKLINVGPMPSFVALAYHAVLKNKNPKTELITSAYTPIGGAEILIWLMGDTRLMMPHGWIYLPAIKVNSHGISFEYAQILSLIDEYMSVADNAGKMLRIPELNQLGLLAGSPLDIIFNKDGHIYS
ncbi:MAG: hypothetical protein ACOY3I_10545 [Verrucomicrobiota bacterium]